MVLRTRFAPSPTGLLHVGNAYSALICQRWADSNRAELLLRIEDIDHTRCRPAFVQAIYTDLHWLGLHWPQAVRIQSEHSDAYRQAMNSLRALAVIYPCFCTRKSIQQEILQMGLAPHTEASTAYPGTCRHLSEDEQQQRMARESFAWRLDTSRAFALSGSLQWHDEQGCCFDVEVDDDVVIGRKDIGFSYHLAVVVDDAIQGISHIIRGEDLHCSTGIHRLLQHLLQLPEPVYMHHPLLLDSHGKRLAKRSHATSLQSLRSMGVDAGLLRHYLLSASTHSWPFSDQDEQAILAKLGKAA